MIRPAGVTVQPPRLPPARTARNGLPAGSGLPAAGRRSRPEASGSGSAHTHPLYLGRPLARFRVHRVQQLEEDVPSPAPCIRPLPGLRGARLPAREGQLPGSSGFLRPGPHPSPGPHGPPAAASFLHRPQPLSGSSSIYTREPPSTPPASVFLPLACCLSTAEPLLPACSLSSSSALFICSGHTVLPPVPAWPPCPLLGASAGSHLPTGTDQHSSPPGLL
eukprot:XP_028336244.1 transcription initiation factor TFIID subunit 4-like isoform X1 [Physeter catodon]